MTEITQQGNNARQIAVKIHIAYLISGTYIQEVEQNPNYLQTIHNQKIYRLNVIAIIIQKEILGTITNFLMEDSTGTIVARFFEENKYLERFKVGDVVLVVGKVRTYNQEKYISPEIIKKVSPLWLKMRLKELKLPSVEENKELKIDKGNQIQQKRQQPIISTVQQDKLQEEDVVEDNIILPYQKITQLIQDLDVGEGVRIEEIMEKSPLQNTEEIIETMLKNGDIFQNSPGKVKVL